MILFSEKLGPGDIYTCDSCDEHLSVESLFVSKEFKGKTGQAYLIADAWNCRLGPELDRNLTTGQHKIKEAFCKNCDSYIGWTYVRAYQRSQQYKVGKFIFEKATIQEYKAQPDKISKPRRARKFKVEKLYAKHESNEHL